MRLYLILAATLAASSAQANDIAPTATKPFSITADSSSAESLDWTGVYAGAQFGTGDTTITTDGPDGKFGHKGYGLHIGYMHDFGRIVAGADVTYNRLSVNASSGHGNNEMFRLRGGYDLGHFMPYIAVGIGHLSAGNNGFSETGPALGIGVSLNAAKNVTVSIEYAQQKITHDYVRRAIVHGHLGDFENVRSDYQTGLLQTRISYRF